MPAEARAGADLTRTCYGESKIRASSVCVSAPSSPVR